MALASSTRASALSASVARRPPLSAFRRASRARHGRRARHAAASAVDTVPLGVDGGAYAKELASALDAVRLASELCQEVQGQLMRMDEQAETKEDRSLVTLADYAAQAIISWRIAQDFPDMTLVGEEDAEALTEGGEGGAETLNKVTNLVNKTLKGHMGEKAPTLSSQDVVDAINRGQSTGGPTGKHWILDPVDGTLGFVRGDQYAIALALMDDGDLKVGVMGCPNMPKTGEVLEFQESYAYGFSPRLVSKMLAGDSLGWYKGCIFTAVRGKGTYMFPTDPTLKFEPVKVSVSEAFDPRKAKFTEPVMKANSSQGFTAAVATNLGIECKPLRIYSQVKYGSVARADADVFMKFPKAGYMEKIWDHAAGVILVEEAGGTVSDAGGAPLNFAGGRYIEGLDRGIIAASSALHAKLLDSVAKSWSSSQL
ncbi:putative PAP-specific phosphatase [Ostreococcus tauri]|uniref:3'(2'),5'-bisphosphate nucleotidase n=1 Tax=Ostreococcus tauri TaxID=70448 RepID=A0A1Y5I4T2_OSTTA|nr:putative PAP-specific phosphatase [Ostreococcus tauri]